MSDKNFKVKNGLDVGGTATATLFSGSGASLTNISFSGLSGISLGTPTTGEALVYNGTNWVDANATSIATGTPTLGSLTGGGIMNSITSTNSISDNLALLSKNVGALLSNAGVSQPTNFPNSQTATITTTSGYAIATGYSPSLNGNTGITTTAGTGVYRIITASPTISLSTVTSPTYSGGPGDSGTLTMSVNGLNGATRTLVTGSDNGTYSASTSAGVSTSFTIANSSSYPAGIPGFYEVIQLSAMTVSSLPAGFNKISITHSTAGTINITSSPIFYDNQTAPTPVVTPTSVTPPATPTYLYSSGIPHYTNASANNFTLNYTVSNISGNLYGTNPSVTASTTGAFTGSTKSGSWPAISSSIPSIPNANDAGPYTGVAFSLPIISGFGQNSSKPTITFSNVYNTTAAIATNTLSGWNGSTSTILYKTGTANAVEETSIGITSTGSGTGNAYRIVLNSSSDTPAYSGIESTYVVTNTLGSNEATNVNNKIQYDQTDYSTNYLPVGPNYSGRGTSQYFTFAFVRTSVSQFKLNLTAPAGISGCWVALPGSSIYEPLYSSTNGWGDATKLTASGGVATGTAINTATTTAQTGTITFGTDSSSNTLAHQIYVRIKLTNGQSLTALSIG